MKNILIHKIHLNSQFKNKRTMKKLLLLIITCLSIGSLSAQDQYTSGMSKALDLWKKGESTKAVALFERISQAEKDKWIPSYYAANVLILQSFESKDMTEVDNYLESAKKHIAEAHKRSENNSEIYTMEGLLYTAYITTDPATYGMKLSGKVNELYTKATMLDPSNPRALANKIEFEMGGARFFKQDLSPFCKRFEEVLPLFDDQKSDIPFAPKYGKERIVEHLKSCKGE